MAKKKKSEKKRGNITLRNYLYAAIVTAVILTIVNSTNIIPDNTISGQLGKDIRRPQLTSTMIPISCEDSDNGLDYNTAGFITAKYTLENGNTLKRVFEDRCIGASKLIETYCVGNVFGSRDYDCKLRCQSGYCLEEKTESVPRTYEFLRK